MTIHKIQGQTLNNVVVNLGKRERTRKLAFVALSEFDMIPLQNQPGSKFLFVARV